MVAANEVKSPSLAESQFNKRTIARLSSKRISEMKTPEMIKVVRSADLPVGCHIGLEHKDESIIRRMVYLARRSCRHQVS